MSLTGADWVKLNDLLDQALDLEPEQRSRWMDALPVEYAALRATLRELLARQAGIETHDVLRRAPRLPLDALSPVAADDRIGPYRLLEQIGSGGMATVWLAERADGAMRRRVALKLPRVYGLDAELAARLDRERDILASLEHPGIARLYDAGVHEGRPYLALEYVEGVTLDTYAARRASTVRQRVALFEQVARAVAYAHARLIVHRDLKPTNVLVRASGEVLLLDFGIARLLAPDQGHQVAVRAFTPRYAAPEQFAGETPTVATDVYSLGVMLYELLAGCSPYVVHEDIVCLQARPLLATLDAQAAREVGVDLAAIVTKALEPRPADRYASIGELLDDLARWRRHQPVRARPDSFGYRARKFVRRNTAVVGLAAALLLAIGAGAGLSMRQADLALRERDRAVQMLEESTATNEFWNRVLSEGVANDESVSTQELLQRSEAIAQRAATISPLQYAVAIDSIAAMYLSYGLPGKAETLLSRTLEQYQSIDEGKHVMCYLRCEYALAIGSLGRTQEAERIFGEVLRGVENEPGVRQYCLQSRAAVASENFDAANALKYMQEAQRLHDASPVRSSWQSARLHGELAYAYGLNGAADLAERHYQHAWDTFERLGRDESHVALSMLNNWGILATGMGDPAAALVRYDRAVTIALKRSPDGQPPPDLIGNRAAALAALGRYEEAAAEFERMRDRATADGNVRLVAFAVAGSADANLRRGEVALARARLNNFSAADRAALEQGSPPLLRIATVEARLAASLGDLTAANALLDTALAGFDKLGAAIRPRVLASIARAEVMLATGRAEAAAADAQRALDMAVLTRGGHAYSDLVGLAAATRAKVYRVQGDDAAATRTATEAVGQLERALGGEHPDTRAARLLANELSMT